MTDFILSPHVRVSEMPVEAIENTAVSRSIFSGKMKTQARAGGYYRFRLRCDNASSREGFNSRAYLQALRPSLRGAANRIWIWDPSYRQRGSFQSPELMSNGTFSNGTTGHTPTNCTLTANDRVLRLTVTTPAANVQTTQSVTPPAANVPLVLRSFLLDGAQTSGLSIGPFLTAGNNTANGYSTSRGLRTISAVCDSASSQTQFPVVFSSTSGFNAGAFLDCPFTSVTPCFLVDNGQNALTRSDEFNHADWTKTNLSAGTNDVTAPDGTATADSLTENTANAAHAVTHAAVTVSSSAGDYSIGVAIKAAGRAFAYIAMTEGAGSTTILQYFSLSGAGAVGANGATGANWSNRRAFVKDMGNGWIVCYLVGRKTNAATSLSVDIGASTADGTGSYLGTSAHAFSLWRATLAQSGVPTRLVQTTSTATTGTSQTGSALYVKGLPASTSGLFLQGDRVQVGTQMCIVNASLDSDGAQLGYIQFERPIRSSPSDNAPVIVNMPMALCKLVEPGGWSERPGGFSDFDMVFDETCEAA